jgi:DNA-binding NarL/FixJ family response regulator
MKIATFILVADSALLRLGLVSLLHRIQGVRVLKEFGIKDPFIVFMENRQVDYIIISQAGFDHSIDLYISKPELLERTILLKDSSNENLKKDLSLRDVHASIKLSDEKETIIQTILAILHQRQDASVINSVENLSPRETTIVRLVSMGLTNRQIAEKLFLSTHTVMTHRKNINNKLGIKSVSGLTVYAIVNNIITLEELSSFP